MKNREFTIPSGETLRVDYKSGTPLGVDVIGPGDVIIRRTLRNGSTKELDGSPVTAGEQVVVMTTNAADYLEFEASGDNAYVELSGAYLTQ
jgi:hypothetical protein